MPKVDGEHLRARRQQIMDAAVTCFARNGFHRATMADVIRESGMSAGSFYRYFQSKEDIVVAIAEQRHAEQAAALADVSSAEVGDALRKLASSSLSRLIDPDEQQWRRVTVALWAEALRDDRILAIVRGGLDGPVEAIAEIIRRGQSEAIVATTLDPDATAQVCAAMFQGLVLQQAWNPAIDVDAYLGAVVALIDLIAVRHPSTHRH
jgi:TetR/AcrR family transcriptional regulator, transcriptional repressor of aconitase